VSIDASGPAGGGEPGSRRQLLGELLVQAKVLDAQQLAEVLEAPREPGKKLGQLLIERGYITEAQLTQTLSLQLSVPWVSLYHIDFSRQLLNRVSRDLAERYCLIPIFVRHVKGQGETLYVAMDDPTNEQALAEVSIQASLPTRPMIASASDIRSAIRVYYGEPSGQVIDVPIPPTRAEGHRAASAAAGADAPNTTREGAARRSAPPPPPTPPVATQPDPPRASTRGPSQPPPVPAARRAPPPPPTSEQGLEPPPPTTRSNPPPGAAAAAASGAEEPPVPRAEDSEPRRMRARMLSLTLLDGTTIQVPAKKRSPAQDGLTARDYVSALRAAAHGADATEVLGEKAQWEPVVAALLSILLRKGLIADWEFVEELRKI